MLTNIYGSLSNEATVSRKKNVAKLIKSIADRYFIDNKIDVEDDKLLLNYKNDDLNKEEADNGNNINVLKQFLSE